MGSSPGPSFYTAGVVGGSPSGIESADGGQGSLRCQFYAPTEEELHADETSVSLNLT
jgi:hypothetical protein